MNPISDFPPFFAPGSKPALLIPENNNPTLIQETAQTNFLELYKECLNDQLPFPLEVVPLHEGCAHGSIYILPSSGKLIVRLMIDDMLTEPTSTLLYRLANFNPSIKSQTTVGIVVSDTGTLNTCYMSVSFAHDLQYYVLKVTPIGYQLTGNITLHCDLVIAKYNFNAKVVPILQSISDYPRTGCTSR